MRRLLLVACLFAGQAMLFAADEQAKQPLDGGSRVMELFPEDVQDILPEAMLFHGAPQGISSVNKNPRNDKARDAVNKKQ